MDQALRVLELFSTGADVPFDRILASRALGEAQRAIPGDDCQAWSQRLVEVGESLNLRVRSIECTWRQALAFAQQSIPIATCIRDARDELQWVLISEVRRGRLRVTTSDSSPSHGAQTPIPRGTGDQWMSQRRLRRLLGLNGESDQRRWIIGQAALGCESASHHDQPHQEGADHGEDGHEHLSPLNRLMALVRPERSDIWTVVVFSVFVGVLALASPIAVEALVNTVAFGKYLQPVVILALLLLTFLSFAAAMRALMTYVVEILQRRLFIRVVEDLAYRLPRVRQHAWDQHHGSELVNRFFDVVTLQKMVASLLLDGISIVLQTVIGMLVLAFYHPFLLGFDVVLLAMIALIVFVLGRGAVVTSIQESRAKYSVAAWLQELARHPTAFKLHAGSQFALDRADQLAVRWLDARRSHFRVLMRQIIFALGLQAVASTALLGLGGWLVISRELTLGQLVASELIVMTIVGSFAKIGKHLESFYDLLAATDKLGHLFDLPIERHDKLFHLPDGSAAELSLHGVSYDSLGHTVLRNVNFRVPPGVSVALTGPAGSGKSKLIDLLCGIRSPSSGHVQLDGMDIRELRPDSLREHLAAARTVEIFHGTINENVHLNRPNISAMDVREALDAVGLLDELLRLPGGLQSVLQTGGGPLSSSQALRLMLARAIVGRPRLLLIDGTLDALPDDMLQRLLPRLAGPATPWTLVVATGRPEVIEACQRELRLSPAEQPSPVNREVGAD
ncbi:MAG: ATP-binding cassette domain-containing protein [Pirellulaceae bacterium]|nr:ATP-binding cassette domain-containing protein [Pirellulaceae bacterium]